MLIIRLFAEIRSIFNPIIIIAQTIFLPLLIGGVLFYLFLPMLKKLEERWKFKRWASILSIVGVIVAVIWIFVAIVGPPLTAQVNKLAENAPEMWDDIQKMSKNVWEQKDKLPAEAEKTMDESFYAAKTRIQSIVVGIGTGIVNILQGVFQGVLVLILVPFFLIYMLKDHEKLAPFIAGFFHGDKRQWVRKVLADIDSTLQAYIRGQVTVSVFVGILLLIGYLIIGLEYALLLAIFGMFMNVIPFIGPYISVIPALVIALLQEPKMAIYVAIIMLIAQQVESNFISPRVMSRALDVHPLTVITVILAAGNIAGFIGILVAMPAYAVGKVILKNIYARRVEIREAVTKEVE